MSRYQVVTIRGAVRPYAVIDTRRHTFVLDEDGALLLSETAAAAAVIAADLFHGVDRIGGAR